MISVIIPTHESERALVRTLACLIPGATAGLVREVILADGGSTDETAKVGDVAGCIFLRLAGSRGARLKAAAQTARSEWLLFLRPGTVLESGWVAETEIFMSAGLGQAAAFRPMAGLGRSPLRESLWLLLAALTGDVRASDGLLIAKSLYRELGGHPADSDKPERDLVRRIGTRSIVPLAARAAVPPDI